MPSDHDNANEGDTSQGGEPKYATIEEVTEAVSELVNKAITNRNKAFEGKMTGMLSELTAKFEERMKAQAAPAPSSSGPESKVEDTPVFKGLQKQLADMQQKLEATEREKRAERAKGRDKDLRQRLSDELTKAGVDPARVRHAVGFLVDSDKRVRYVDEDTDEVVFTDEDNQEVDFRTGLRNWMKSDDSKIYQSARGTTGTGDRRPQEKTSRNGSSNVNQAQAAEDAMLGLLELHRRGDI